MGRWSMIASVSVCGLLLIGCEAQSPAKPAPKELTRESAGHYCQMTVLDHPGPKGQIFVGDLKQPIWFSSVRDTIAFTRLREERKDIRAIYVNDMARAETWESPGPGTWIGAEDAAYVIGSDARGGMGAREVVPFGDRVAAERFAAERGGRIVAWRDVPTDYVLGSDDAGSGAATEAADAASGHHEPGQGAMEKHQ